MYLLKTNNFKINPQDLEKRLPQRQKCLFSIRRQIRPELSTMKKN